MKHNISTKAFQYAHRVGGATPSGGNNHSRQPSPQSSPASGRGGDRPFPRMRGKVRKGVGLSCIPSRKAEFAAMRDLIRGSKSNPLSFLLYPDLRLNPEAVTNANQYRVSLDSAEFSQCTISKVGLDKNLFHVKVDVGIFAHLHVEAHL